MFDSFYIFLCCYWECQSLICEASWWTYLQLAAFTTTHSYTGILYAKVLEFHTKTNLLEEKIV